MIILDEIDNRILRELERDGRLSNIALAERVHLSPSACLRRVQDLEKRDIIQGYRAIVDRKAVGGGFTVMVTVGLSRHLKTDQQQFERAMSLAAEGRECQNVAGQIEYLLRVEVSDLEAYKQFHTDILGTVPQVSSITSYIVMGSPKDERR